MDAMKARDLARAAEVKDLVPILEEIEEAAKRGSYFIYINDWNRQSYRGEPLKRRGFELEFNEYNDTMKISWERG